MPNFWYCIFCNVNSFSNSLVNGEYSNILIVAAFSNESFYGKTGLHVKNSYLIITPDDNDDKVVSFTKNENGSLVQSLYSYKKSLNSISDEWFDLW